MVRSAILPAAFRGIIVIAMTVMLFSCVNDPEDVKAVKQNQELPVEWAEDVEMIYSESGNQKVLMMTPRLEKYAGGRERYTLMPEGIHAIFYDSLMTERSSIRAGYAVEYPDRRTVEARYAVQVVNETGDTLNTESLTWDRNQQKIYTNAAVRIITHEKEVIYGTNGMEADERFTRWRIKNIRESSLIIRESEDQPKND
ncbi:MAG: LPS export ABC transporter periplasmic protein LptC [Bacteroidales bacterium]